MADLPWEGWALLVTAVLGSGGGASWWALSRDRQDKAQARLDGAPVAAADRLASLLTRMEEISGKATDAMERAMSAEETADMASREARSAIHRAEQAESDVQGLVAYMRLMGAGILNGSVPPRPPIPHHIRHLLSDQDFPSPPDPPRTPGP